MSPPTRSDSGRPTRQPLRSKAGGLSVLIATPIVAAYLLFKLFSAHFDDGRFYIFGAGFILIGALPAVGLGRKLRAPDALELMARDPRPPIVFLRPFEEDRRVVYGQPAGLREGGASPNRDNGKCPHEQTLANLLRGLGPFIAVGKPGESLATLGAARTYLSDDHWEDAVKAMVRRASAIILQPELSQGTLWEVLLVANTVDLSQLLLIVPNPSVRPLRYVRIRELVHERLDVTLPELGACPPCDAFYFDAGKNPIPLLLETPSFLGLKLPEWIWRVLQAEKEARADAIASMPPVLLVSSRNLTKAARPFLDRIAALSRVDGVRT